MRAIPIRFIAGIVMLIIIFVVIAIYSFYTYYKPHHPKATEFTAEIFSDSDYSLSLDGKILDESNFIELDSLKGDIAFNIKEKNFQVLNFFLDNQDILRSPFYKIKSNQGNFYTFSPTHNLSPGVHTVQAVLSSKKNRYIQSKERKFTISYSPNLKEVSIDKNFFVIPAETKLKYGDGAWYVANNQIISTQTTDSRASLAIIYPQRRFSIKFKVTPLSNTGSFSFYFLEINKRFVFGDGDFCNISFLENNQEHDDKKIDFCLKKNKTSDFLIEKNESRIILSTYDLSGEKVEIFNKEISSDDDRPSYIGFSVSEKSGPFSLSAIKLFVK